jgi:hypothetical protein
MPIVLAWLLVLVPSAFASWCFAGFVMHWREHGRLLAATLAPAAAVSCYLYADYWSKRVAPAEPGWDILFALVSIVAGASTLLTTLPVYWLAERTLGGRAA